MGEVAGWKKGDFKSISITYFKIYLYLVCWVFSSCGKPGLFFVKCLGFSFQWLLLLWSTGFRCMGSVVVAHGTSCSTACGISLNQGSHLCPPHWQVDSYPLWHRRCPIHWILVLSLLTYIKWPQCRRHALFAVAAVVSHYHALLMPKGEARKQQKCFWMIQKNEASSWKWKDRVPPE